METATKAGGKTANRTAKASKDLRAEMFRKAVGSRTSGPA